ncbi:uncharacterized protein N0V89_012495 [Didymosphaeria variabile]|uniref:L domain-like protein n=1 Tax=Didymosphaeria variabile TaxID=1932322 RepID=A0A9W8X9Q0_9PLEO|nr:uncharacterized protein N0V89_012495 [Didymosphaeria variabile]KAJ4344751.1 hypothetical protein N0V89_012495 [Didymosphaeria variabile]
MHEDPLPSSAHATNLDSPLLDPRYSALKSSSPPPLFSENDSLDTADVTNYESPRDKRKRAGTWWQTGPRGAPKRRQFNRNFDSGVYMMSDDSEASAPASSAISYLGFDSTSDIPSDPPAPESLEHSDEGIEPTTKSTSAWEARISRVIQQGLDSNEMHYNLQSYYIQDDELHQLGMLNQIVTVPPGIDVDVPAEGQYRSMIPEIHVNLSLNELSRLSPTLFNLQYLTSLTLRHNAIEAIPPQIKELTNLKTLDLCYNLIHTLPCELLSLCTSQGQGSLMRLELAGNPLYEFNNTGQTAYLNVALAMARSKSPTEVLSTLAQREPKVSAMMLRCTELEWSEFEGHHLYTPPSVKVDDVSLVQDTLFLIHRTTASYYDHTGRLLKGSPALPMREQPDQNCDTSPSASQSAILTHTSLGAVGIPDIWFDRPSSFRVPSLATLSLVKAYNTEPDRVREEVDYYVGGSIPGGVEATLAKAEENDASMFKPLRSCHCCGRDYIVPRAEWIEGWFFQQQILPIKVAVCSWACVPDIIAKRPEPWKWTDIPERL